MKAVHPEISQDKTFIKGAFHRQVNTDFVTNTPMHGTCASRR